LVGESLTSAGLKRKGSCRRFQREEKSHFPGGVSLKPWRGRPYYAASGREVLYFTASSKEKGQVIFRGREEKTEKSKGSTKKNGIPLHHQERGSREGSSAGRFLNPSWEGEGDQRDLLR